MTENQKNTLWYVLVLAGAILMALPVFHTLMFDDAYIHARVVGHLLQDGVPYYNIGDALKTSSSTGYTILLAGVTLLTGDAVSAIRWVQALAIALTFTGLCILARKTEGSLWTRLAAMATCLPMFLWIGYSGMESTIVCLMMTGMALAWRADRHSTVLVLAACAAIFRMEAFLLLVLCLFQQQIGGKKPFHRPWWMIPLLVFAVFDLHFYGTLVPHAAKAKAILFSLPLLLSIRFTLSFNSLAALDHPDEGLWVFMKAPGVALLAIAAATSIQRLFDLKRLPIAEIFLYFAAGVLAVYCLSPSLIYPWYFEPIIFGFGLYTMLAPPMSWKKNALEKTLVLSLQLFFCLVACYHLMKEDDNSFDLRINTYRRIATTLYDECPQCTLATSEIGALGYYFKGTLYDGAGLADQKAVDFQPLPMPEGRSGYYSVIPPGYIKMRQPDFIVSMPLFTEALRASPDIIGKYVEYRCDLGGSLWRSTYMNVYSLRPLSPDVLKQMACHAPAKEQLNPPVSVKAAAPARH